jgi:hypothetical protein
MFSELLKDKFLKLKFLDVSYNNFNDEEGLCVFFNTIALKNNLRKLTARRLLIGNIIHPRLDDAV